MTTQADDISAINDYFNRMAAKTTAAKVAKESWNSWYKGLSFISKSFTEPTLNEAIKRRTVFDAANGEVARLSDGGLTEEEKTYFANLPSADITGQTPEQAKVTIAAAAAKGGAQLPVPSTLLVAKLGALRQGSVGEAVKEWQAIVGVPVDGRFGPATTAATKKWQAAHGLVTDGVVGPACWTAAQASKPSVVTQLLQNIPSPTATQNYDVSNTIPSPPAKIAVATAPSGTNGRPILRSGMKVPEVKVWQSTLNVPTTGIYDVVTIAAVKRWQAAHGLVADGVVGAATWAKWDALGGISQEKLGPGGVLPAATAAVTPSALIKKVGAMPTWGKWASGVIALGSVGLAALALSKTTAAK